MLTGIALLYGRTGALNMAQIGHTLAGHPADGLVTIALLMMMGGLLVKAAIVPLHFWLADAHDMATRGHLVATPRGHASAARSDG